MVWWYSRLRKGMLTTLVGTIHRQFHHINERSEHPYAVDYRTTKLQD